MYWAFCPNDLVRASGRWARHARTKPRIHEGFVAKSGEEEGEGAVDIHSSLFLSLSLPLPLPANIDLLSDTYDTIRYNTIRLRLRLRLCTLTKEEYSTNEERAQEFVLERATMPRVELNACKNKNPQPKHVHAYKYTYIHTLYI